MKTILIETVTNGWIVRPFQSGPEWAVCERPCIAVYNKLEDLQEDIPKLLEFNAKPPVADDVFIERMRAYESIPGDRTPEATGGNEKCPSA